MVTIMPLEFAKITYSVLNILYFLHEYNCSVDVDIDVNSLDN